LKRVLKATSSKGVSRLVPWVNGVKGGETNSLEGLNSRTRGLGFDGVAMARPPNQNPKEKKAYLGVAKARPKALSSFLETSLAKRLAYKHKSRAEKCCFIQGFSKP
jgi:hypothetical protein